MAHSNSEPLDDRPAVRRVTRDPRPATPPINGQGDRGERSGDRRDGSGRTDRGQRPGRVPTGEAGILRPVRTDRRDQGTRPSTWPSATDAPNWERGHEEDLWVDEQPRLEPIGDDRDWRDAHTDPRGFAPIREDYPPARGAARPPRRDDDMYASDGFDGSGVYGAHRDDQYVWASDDRRYEPRGYDRPRPEDRLREEYSVARTAFLQFMEKFGDAAYTTLFPTDREGNLLFRHGDRDRVHAFITEMSKLLKRMQYPQPESRRDDHSTSRTRDNRNARRTSDEHDDRPRRDDDPRRSARGMARRFGKWLVTDTRLDKSDTDHNNH